MTVRFTTYNLLDLFGADTAEHQRHYETVTEVIRELDADVLAVQEILAPDAGTAARRLRQLADDTGMNCEVPAPGGPGDSGGPGGPGGPDASGGPDGSSEAAIAYTSTLEPGSATVSSITVKRILSEPADRALPQRRNV